MIDTTTPKDLAKKIEWVGLGNLTHAEREYVGSDLVETSRYLPRLLALALWSYFGQRAPENLLTRGSEHSTSSYQERKSAKSLIAEIMADYYDEESTSEF